MEIRLPSQSVFLAGESLEVDNLVKRARPIDGADPRSRALVPQPTLPAASATRAVVASDRTVDYASVAARYQARVRTPADLYLQVSAADWVGSKAQFVDVYA